MSVNPNGEAEVINIVLKPAPRMKSNRMEYNFAELAIKSRSAKGNTLTPRVIGSINRKTEGISTLSARKIWFDSAVKRLNSDQRGIYLGEFASDDKILTLYASGHYRITNYDLSNHFDDDLICIEKFVSDKPVSVFYLDKESQNIYLKRFLIEPSTKKVNFFEEQEGAILKTLSTDRFARVAIEDKEYEIGELCDVFKLRAKGKRISKTSEVEIRWLEPLPEFEQEPIEEETDLDSMELSSELNDNDTVQGSLF